MPESILGELVGTIRRHPWWCARARLTLALLWAEGILPSARVLDAGCGWGVTLEHLERSGYATVGLDVARSTLEQLDRPNRHLIEADLTQPVPESSVVDFDAVLALDVIEHIDDDRAAVERIAQLVRPGALVVVSVPALPELYSEFDAIQGHRRRYTPETLRAAFEGTGLELVRWLWWGAWLVPLLRRQRCQPRGQVGQSSAEVYRQYLQVPPWPISWGLALGFALEHRPTLAGRLRAGTSLFALARRPK